MRRGARALGVVAVYALGVAFVGGELHTWRGALVGVLLIWGAVELIRALVDLAGDATLRHVLHGVASAAAIIVGLALADTWRWIAFALSVVALAWVYGRYFPGKVEEEE